MEGERPREPRWLPPGASLKKLVVVAVLVLGILSPGFQVISGMPVVRGEDLALIAVAVAMVLGGWRLRSEPHVRQVDRAFVAMGVLATTSICLAPFLYGASIAAKDWMILPMLTRYWVIFRVGYSVDGQNGRSLLVTAGLIAFGACAAVGILQCHDLGGVNRWLTPLYKGNDAPWATSTGELARRVGGTHGDPRQYGYLLAAGIALTVAVLLSHNGRKMLMASSAVLLGALFLALTYTLSRTATLAALIVVVLALLMRQPAGRAPKQQRILLALGLACLLVALYPVFGTQAYRERVLSSGTESFDTSLSARRRDLRQPFLAAISSPAIFLVGRGPAKEQMRTSSHNDYGWYFHRFGLLGLAFYLLLIAWGLRQGHGRYRSSQTPTERALNLTCFLVVILWAVFAMAEAVFKDGQMMTLNMLALGILHAPLTRARLPFAVQQITLAPGRPALTFSDGAAETV